MEVEECKISVWVCREEKLVSGVTRRTSCADVVRVLLEDRSAPALARSAQNYCIVEKWRGFERVLPNRTKILRLWTAWGREQTNVRFVLVRSDASLPGSGPRSAQARVITSKESRAAETTRHPGTPVSSVGTPEQQISQEKRRRVVRKAFRKLDKMKKKKEEKKEEEEEESCSDDYAETMETLVHLVLSQDHTIRQQTQRIRELDTEIDRHESLVHTDRIRRHGVNYVQDTYLVDTGDIVELDADTMVRCDQLILLQEQLVEKHALLKTLTAEIQEELVLRWEKTWRHEGDAEGGALELRWEKTRRPEGDAEGGPQEELELRWEKTRRPEGDTEEGPQEEVASESVWRLEQERMRTQLETSSYIGLRLNTDLEAVQDELEESLRAWEDKESQLRELLVKVDSCGGCGEDAGEGDTVDFTDHVQPPPPPAPCSVEQSDCWVEQVRGLSKTNPSGNDDDSDTGLSSMHSQDSDNPAVCESLV